MKSLYPMPDCEFDIDRVYVFSVERAKKESSGFLFWKTPGKERTVIGYFDKNWEVKEWYLDCSLAKHQEFVDRFRRKLDRDVNQVQ